jgi:hypothetical protein
MGRLARWLAIAGIFLGGLGLVPLLAVFALWLMAAAFGAADATPYLFFGGLLSLVSALPVLFRAVAGPGKSQQSGIVARPSKLDEPAGKNDR